MSFDINNIRSNLTYGGARPSKFEVVITNPINPIADIKVPLLCRASRIPASTMGRIPVAYKGRKIYEPGDRNFDEEWTVTIYNDEDNLIRNALETWSNAMNAHQRNITLNGPEPGNYKSQGTVTSYGKDGRILRVYQMIGVFPTVISAMDVDWAAENTIQEFQVTFSFDEWVIANNDTGTFVP